jgi:hypothetical protein
MKRIILLSLAALAITSCLSLNIVVEMGDGVPVETSFQVGNFNALSIPSFIDVVYTQTQGSQSVTLTCDQNLLEYYQIRVENNVLVADTKPGMISLTPRVRTVLTVSSPVLNEVKVTGSGDCTINGPVAAEDDFLLGISGSGDINVNGRVECEDFAAATTGSGDISVAGVTAQTAQIRSSGSGNIGIDALKADDIRASTTGSGDIILVCNDAGDIEATTSGSGSIYLSGRAISLVSNSTGSGRVDATGLIMPVFL